MTREELIDKLNYFINPANNIGAVLYFVIEHEGETIIRFADIENNAKLELKRRFLEYINEKFIVNEELHFKNISEADDRKNVVYKYDIDEKLESLNILNDILENENQIHFNFNNDELKNIQGYLITIGNESNKMALYKKHHSMNILKRDRFLLYPSGERLVEINNDVIALDKTFDFMMLDENLIVLKLNILERYFGFENVIRNQASSTIDIVEANELLEDIQQLIDLSKSIPNARKLMRIQNSPVLNVPVRNVINFIKNHPELTGKINFNANGTKINLETVESKKLFLKLLNDDYLFSQLTELQYDSHAKDKLLETQNEN